MNLVHAFKLQTRCILWVLLLQDEEGLTDPLSCCKWNVIKIQTKCTLFLNQWMN